MEEKENEVVEESASESIVEIVKDTSTTKLLQGEKYLTCGCRVCGAAIKNEKVVDGFANCPECGKPNKC